MNGEAFRGLAFEDGLLARLWSHSRVNPILLGHGAIATLVVFSSLVAKDPVALPQHLIVSKGNVSQMGGQGRVSFPIFDQSRSIVCTHEGIQKQTGCPLLQIEEVFHLRAWLVRGHRAGNVANVLCNESLRAELHG